MKFIKKYKGYILAFLIPFIIYFLFFLWKGVFTDKTIMTSDMLAQYQSLFQYLKNVLQGTESFPYTFSKGLGGGMWGSLFYAFSDPINLLIYYFDSVQFFVTCIILLKLSLSGFTMYTFLKYKFKDEKYLLVFSLAYALMGYNVTYYTHIMWLDGVLLAPIILLGIEKMLNEKKDLIYIVSLFLAIFTSYYIGYMLTLFSCIYFLYQYLLRNEKRKQLVHFFIITLLVGLMTTFILLPVGLELLNVIRINTKVKWINFNFLDLFAPTYIGMGNLVNPLNDSTFLIFVGTIMLPLLICYFSNKDITKKEKVLTVVVYMFLLLPILFPQLNRLWHLSTLPMRFGFRYSFLGSLFTTIIMLKSLQKLKVSKKKLSLFFVLYIIFSCSLMYANAQEQNYYYYLSNSKIIVTVFLLGFNILLLVKNKIKIVYCVLVLEMVLNLGWIGIESELFSNSDYYEAREKLQEFSSYCEKDKRCETTFNYTLNDPLFANYNGVSVFLTAQNGKVLKFLNSLVYRVSNSTKYHPDLALDTLLGISIIETKYPLYGYDLIEEYQYQGVDLYLFNNPNALGLGYLVSSNIKDLKMNKKGFELMEDILDSMDEDNKDYFYSLPMKKISDKEYEVQKNKNYSALYIEVDCAIKINGEGIGDTLSAQSQYLVLYDKYGDNLSITLEEPVDDFKIYVLDEEKLKEFAKNRVNLIIDNNNGNKVEGHIEVNEASTLFTTIPYEKGWEVFVDGKKVNSYEVLDTFLAIDLEEGYHTITFEYHVYGLEMGIGISIISFLFLCGYEYRYKRENLS